MTVFANVQSQDLRAKLEASYKAFSEAIKAKDAEKLKASLSSYAYMNVKNQLLSSGAKFPDALFAMGPMILQNISKLQYRKAIQNGPTAYCIYSGKDEFGETGISIFKFLEENGSWKFNMEQKLSSDEIAKAVKANDFSFLEKEDKYKPDGVMPVVPAEIIPGDYKAMLDVMCYGYEVQATVNGNVQSLVKGGSSSGALMGGLKKGTNKIILTVKPIEGKEPSSITVTIRALVKGDEKEVFKLNEESPAATITKEFVVE